MKKNKDNRRKNKNEENNLEEPLKEEIELNILSDELNNNNYEKEERKKLPEKKVSFCSLLFFLWTLNIMKLSNNKKLKKEVIRDSPLFTEKEEKEKYNKEFIFLKELWEGKNNKNGFKTWNFCPMILTILRFNLLMLLFLLFLLFIVQLCKMIILYYKRRIINLFYEREQNDTFFSGNFFLSSFS